MQLEANRWLAQMLALFVAVLMISAANARASKAGSGLLRTLAYHQITSFTSDLIINSTPVLSNSTPVLSGEAAGSSSPRRRDRSPSGRVRSS